MFSIFPCMGRALKYWLTVTPPATPIITLITIHGNINVGLVDLFTIIVSFAQGQSRGPPGEISWAPRGNHVGPQEKSRGPPGAITWAPRGNHVGPQGLKTLQRVYEGRARKMPFCEGCGRGHADLNCLRLLSLVSQLVTYVGFDFYL